MDKRYAVIDIGTNSVRLMLADWNGAVVPVAKRVVTTRIGEALHMTGTLSEGGMSRTIDTMRGFLREGEGAQVLAFATSAVRDATNKEEFLRRCRDELRLSVDVVEGEREAVLGFVGAVGEGEGRLIDIGGGSTELIYGKNGRIEFAYSAPVGCVRALSRFPGEADFAGVQDWLRELANEPFARLRAVDAPAYAVGGTATTLFALSANMREYDAKKVQGGVLTRAAIESLQQGLGKQTVDERRTHPLLAQRADIIRYGAALLLCCMEGFGVDSVRVSDSDNLEGYLLEYIRLANVKEQT